MLAYLGHLHLFLCIELRVCRGLLAHAELEQNRRYQRSNDNDQYDRREHVRVDQTGLLALLCYDQRNLTAGYHAQTDGERIIGMEAHDAGTNATADDLGQDCNDGQYHCEDRHGAGQTFQVGLNTDGSEEQRREQHVAEHVGLACNVVTRRGQTAHYDACKVCTGDICNTEVTLCNIAHQECECYRIDCNTAMMMPLLLHLEEYAVHNETNNQYETEERNDAAEYQNRLYRRVSQCGQNGQHHDTEDIVDYSCAEDCCTDFTFQLAHLTQGLDGDRNRGSGQNDTDESSLQHVHRVGRIIVERQIACNTTDQRHDNTDQRNNEGRKTGGFQLVQISIHTCVKHQDDYTDLSGLYQKIGLAYPAEAARANQHAGNQCTDNLRHMHALRSKAEYLCEQHDDRNRQQKVI